MCIYNHKEICSKIYQSYKINFYLRSLKTYDHITKCKLGKKKKKLLADKGAERAFQKGYPEAHHHSGWSHQANSTSQVLTEK